MRSTQAARFRAVGLALVTVTALGLVACNDPTVSSISHSSETQSVLRSDRELTSGCYDFPPSDPTHIDRVDTRVAFEPGEAAVDFTLRDVDGVEHRLSDLLESRPVLLILGSYS